ncbi:hypothetical protein MAUB1S_11429 [Mycolicibacterium aubagnense]
MISLELSITNALALPLAIICHVENGITTIAILVGPLCIEFSWGASL